MTPHMGGLAFCSVGISLSILTQTLWNSVHVVYSILWTHCRYFLWTKLLWGKWRNLSCCHTCRQMPSESEWQNTLMMRLMRLISKFSNVCHIWCVTMMWLGRRSKTKAPLVAVAIVFWMSSCVYKYQLMFVFFSKVESGTYLPPVPSESMFVTYNTCVHAAHLERRLLFCVYKLSGWRFWVSSTVVSRSFCFTFPFSS